MDRYTAMTPSSEGPNPLRPYYKPPSIGALPDNLSNGSTFGASTAARSSTISQSFGSSARDMLSDLNYSEILGDAAPTTGDSLKALMDQAIWKYSSVFMAQPFEVAKTVLQCHLAGPNGDKGDSPWRTSSSRRSSVHPGSQYSDYPSSDEEQEDGPAYFSSTAPREPAPSVRSVSQSSRSRGRRRSSQNRRLSPAEESPRSAFTSTYRLDLRKSGSLTEVLSQLWQKEGAFGLWKATNVTFLYGLLLKTLETWTRSMFSALLNLPDPGLIPGSSAGVGGLDVVDSPSPLISLGVAVAAAGAAGFLLAPLDIVRTRLILTPLTSTPRSVLPALRSLRLWGCPTSLLAPTLLHSTIPTFIATSTPLFLRTNFRIDPVLTPTAYSVCSFIASGVELFFKLPLETVLRRAQMGFVSQLAYLQSSSRQQQSRQAVRDHSPGKLDTVVEVGPYTGVVGTMWRIMREERHVTIVDKEGTHHDFEVADGDNLLDIAQANDLEMEGACGGSCACSTCHVIVADSEMYDRMEEPSDDENDMLDLAFGLTETSRLGCQIIMNKKMDGLVVKLPSMTRNLQASDFAKKS